MPHLAEVVAAATWSTKPSCQPSSSNTSITCMFILNNTNRGQTSSHFVHGHGNVGPTSFFPQRPLFGLRDNDNTLIYSTIAFCSDGSVSRLYLPQKPWGSSPRSVQRSFLV
jgi:hypothetical protein